MSFLLAPNDPNKFRGAKEKLATLDPTDSISKTLSRGGRGGASLLGHPRNKPADDTLGNV
jgi:hypothetical protein